MTPTPASAMATAKRNRRNRSATSARAGIVKNVPYCKGPHRRVGDLEKVVHPEDARFERGEIGPGQHGRQEHHHSAAQIMRFHLVCASWLVGLVRGRSSTAGRSLVTARPPPPGGSMSWAPAECEPDAGG